MFYDRDAQFSIESTFTECHLPGGGAVGTKKVLARLSPGSTKTDHPKATGCVLRVEGYFGGWIESERRSKTQTQKVCAFFGFGKKGSHFRLEAKGRTRRCRKQLSDRAELVTRHCGKGHHRFGGYILKSNAFFPSLEDSLEGLTEMARCWCRWLSF